jgi:hypothetical protein
MRLIAGFCGVNNRRGAENAEFLAKNISTSSVYEKHRLKIN